MSNPKVDQVTRAILIAVVLVAGGVGIALLFHPPPPETSRVTYKGKTLEAWFYGPRRDFFFGQTRGLAEGAFDALGTNAFPFLLSNLKSARGCGHFYWKVYHLMPARIRSRLPYPISGDDIKAITIGNIRRMKGPSGEQLQALADCVPHLRNPRLKMVAFGMMRLKYGADPAFWALCWRLLHNEEPGIQLQAAIWLGEAAHGSDPREPELFPLLIAALESKEKREASEDLLAYMYQQWPPGGDRKAFARLPPSANFGPLDRARRKDIRQVLDRLEPSLTQEQKARFRRAEQADHETG